MADYGFAHDGKVYTPNGTPGIALVANEDRNRAIEHAELETWAGAPARFVSAYFSFPMDGRHRYTPIDRFSLRSAPPDSCQYCNTPKHTHAETEPDRNRTWRATYRPRLTGATVTTWRGTVLGTITAAHVYSHNFGGRFVSLRVKGTNGAEYYGRASWDWGNVIRLRRAK